jgi:hypothetical protein
VHITKPILHYRIHNSPADESIPMAPIRFPLRSFTISSSHTDLVLPNSLGCPTETAYTLRSSSKSSTCLAHPICLYLISRKIPEQLFRARLSCRNMLIVYCEELLASWPPPALLAHQPISALRYCLFIIFATTLRIWRLYSSPATWGSNVTWQLERTPKFFFDKNLTF